MSMHGCMSGVTEEYRIQDDITRPCPSPHQDYSYVMHDEEEKMKESE